MNGTVSGAQLRMIYGLARKVDLDDEQLHELARVTCRAESLKALTGVQAGWLIDRLQAILGRPAAPADRATKGQQGKIWAMIRAMGWADDPKRLRGFLERIAHVSDVRFLDPQQAGVVIEALKAIDAGGRAERKKAGGHEG